MLEGLQKQLDAGYPPYRVPVREDAAILAYRKWLDQAVAAALLKGPSATFETGDGASLARE